MTGTAAVQRDLATPTQVEAIAAFIGLGRSAVGRQARRKTTIAYSGRFGNLTAWNSAPMAARLASPVNIHTLIAFLITTLSYAEVPELIKAQFERYDTDHDGFITIEDAQGWD